MGIVDGSTGEVLWRDTDVRRNSESGLVGMAISNWTEHNQVCAAAEVMVKKPPDRRNLSKGT
jgi:hypothetical protein